MHKTAQQHKGTGGATARRNSELICVMNGEGQEDFCHPKMYIIAFKLGSHVISSVINLYPNEKKQQNNDSTKETKWVKTQIDHLIHAHASLCPPPLSTPHLSQGCSFNEKEDKGRTRGLEGGQTHPPVRFAYAWVWGETRLYICRICKEKVAPSKQHGGDSRGHGGGGLITPGRTLSLRV